MPVTFFLLGNRPFVSQPIIGLVEKPRPRWMAWRARCRNEDREGQWGASEQLLMGWNFLFNRDAQGPILEIGINEYVSKQSTEGKCVDIVTPSLSGFPWSVRRITRISLCILTGLHRTTKHDGGKKIDVPNGK